MLVTVLFGVAGSAAKAASAKVSVVAAEDFWGSIARQLGGEHVDVTSLIADPGTEPHDYEPKPSDGVAVAKAQVAIVNGIGYDGWMSDLLAANPSPNRKVVNVGDVVGVKEGENPHQWYSPPGVDAVIDAVTDALKHADPRNAAYYDRRRHVYRTEGLKRYNELRAQIRARYSGVPVGASESIFAPMAEDLGLNLVTPKSFIDAVSEGNEPTARDKAAADRQIEDKQIQVFIYNAQHSTPDVKALVDKAKKAGISLVTVTETPVPKGASFQDWQADQLQSLADALAESVGTTAPSAANQAPAGPSADAAPGRVPATVPTAAASAVGDETPASSTLARTGASARWLVVLAGAALVLGGLGLVGGASHRRSRSALRAA